MGEHKERIGEAEIGDCLSSPILPFAHSPIQFPIQAADGGELKEGRKKWGSFIYIYIRNTAY